MVCFTLQQQATRKSAAPTHELLHCCAPSERHLEYCCCGARAMYPQSTWIRQLKLRLCYALRRNNAPPPGRHGAPFLLRPLGAVCKSLGPVPQERVGCVCKFSSESTRCSSSRSKGRGCNLETPVVRWTGAVLRMIGRSLLVKWATYFSYIPTYILPIHLFFLSKYT